MLLVSTALSRCSRLLTAALLLNVNTPRAVLSAGAAQACVLLARISPALGAVFIAFCARPNTTALAVSKSRLMFR